ncbi:MAG: putative Rossmann fold nucleotide-binding protein uptake [Ignavibacteria bacterium]|nr:putative Rossmann fold nucleotide-binding protein uptake [Ignavibacteria bacterium]
MIINEWTYWIAITQLKGWRIEAVNKLVVNIFHEQKSSFEEIFSLERNELSNRYNLNEKECLDIINLKEELPNYSFLAEDLKSQGFEIIPINSPDYSPTLKENLKLKSSPTVIYIKGNRKILMEKSIAIVGSREADDISLEFTDNVAKKASKEFKVIVSGFAKGVDRQALESAMKYTGQSIIVLPQGVLTFGSGYQKYYQQIVNGDVLVLSVFHPKAQWASGLAMARNPIIYALAHEIYVAQSSDSGGTWHGVIDGLRKGREIFVRKPEPNEKNANQLLIQRGAIPVDLHGEIQESKKYIENAIEEKYIFKEHHKTKAVAEPDIVEKIFGILKTGSYTSAEIIQKAQLNWKPGQLTKFLKEQNNVRMSDSTPKRFTIVGEQSETLF